MLWAVLIPRYQLPVIFDWLVYYFPASVIRVLSGMTDIDCPIWTVVGMLCQMSVGRHCATCKLFHSFDCLWLPDWHMVMSFAQHWFSPFCISRSPAAVFVFIWCPVRVLHESDTFNTTVYIIRFLISLISNTFCPQCQWMQAEHKFEMIPPASVFDCHF